MIELKWPEPELRFGSHWELTHIQSVMEGRARGVTTDWFPLMYSWPHWGLDPSQHVWPQDLSWPPQSL